jgi:hypothetical protein
MSKNKYKPGPKQIFISPTGKELSRRQKNKYFDKRNKR